MKIKQIILLIFLFSIFGCASPAPIPKTLNIVPPSNNIPPEIAAFSGIWRGRLFVGVDIALVVEKIDTERADVIVSMGTAGTSQEWYQHMDGKVFPGPAIQLIDSNGDTTTYTMEKDFNMIKVVLEETSRKGAKMKGELTRANE